jgi:hypothetical protein
LKTSVQPSLERMSHGSQQNRQLTIPLGRMLSTRYWYRRLTSAQLRLLSLKRLSSCLYPPMTTCQMPCYIYTEQDIEVAEGDANHITRPVNLLIPDSNACGLKERPDC